MPSKKQTPTFESWAREVGWLVGEDPTETSCALCALPDDVLREIEKAWVEFGARDAEVSGYLAALGIIVPSSEPFAHHFRTREHSRLFVEIRTPNDR